MTDFRALCAELVAAIDAQSPHAASLLDRARAALAETEPQRRCLYSPVQIAECGGPCEQGPEHCDCGELCATEPEPEGSADDELSPAAQAVLDAFIGENTIYGLHLMTPKLAAVLRAAADQVVPECYNPPRGVSCPEKEAFIDGKCVRNEDIRYAILAIAAELENTNA